MEGMPEPGCKNSLGSSETEEEEEALSSWPAAEVHDLVILVAPGLEQIYPVSWESVLVSVWTKVSPAKDAESEYPCTQGGSSGQDKE